MLNNGKFEIGDIVVRKLEMQGPGYPIGGELWEIEAFDTTSTMYADWPLDPTGSAHNPTNLELVADRSAIEAKIDEINALRDAKLDAYNASRTIRDDILDELEQDTLAQGIEDMVNHPSHYKTESGLEAITVLEEFGLVMDGRLFNAGKYILRAGKKAGNDEIHDLRKAVWYLNRYIDAMTSLDDIDDEGLI